MSTSNSDKRQGQQPWLKHQSPNLLFGPQQQGGRFETELEFGGFDFSGVIFYHNSNMQICFTQIINHIYMVLLASLEHKKRMGLWGFYICLF